MPERKIPRSNRRLLSCSKTRVCRARKKQQIKTVPNRRLLLRSASEPTVKITNLLSYTENKINDSGFSDGGSVGGRLNEELFIYEGFFASAPLLPFSSPRRSAFRQDSKVVLNVTVEGSPGPVRAMVKLGATVKEAIGIVLEEYRREGRSPTLSCSQTDINSFQLHHSHFNLQSLNKCEMIGELGSRSFYLRKSCDSHESLIDSAAQEITCIGTNIENVGAGRAMDLPTPTQLFFLRRLGKIKRRAKRLWRLVICIACL